MCLGLTVNLPKLGYDVLVDVTLVHHNPHHLFQACQLRECRIVSKSRKRFQPNGLRTKTLEVLDHILRDSVDLFLGVHVWQGVEIQVSIAFQKSRTNSLHLLAILRGRRSIILRPDKVQHLLDAHLTSTEYVSMFCLHKGGSDGLP